MRSVILAVAFACVIAAAHAQRPASSTEWRHFAGDAGSRKYSPLHQIDKSNITRLEIAWRWPSPDNDIVKANPRARPGAYIDTPLVVNGVLYTVTSLGVFAAIDPATGRTLWQNDPRTWKLGRPPNLGFTHRGVAYWTNGRTERIFSGTHDAYLVSIDPKTGKLDPEFGDHGRVDVIANLPYAERMRTYAINSAPVVVKNVVMHGSNISDGPQHKEAPRGDVNGYDARTGKLLWTFHSVPQKGEIGHETWENGSAEYTGGTNVWSMMSIDEELGYVYLPFGTPTNDYYGGHRLGDNLFAESLVCLDATTGKRVWHFQGVHHGLWDYDFPAAPILADITVNGKKIKAVAQVSKQGFVYVFDRRTGAPVWPIDERPVPQSSVPGERTSPTQPFPTKPPAFDRQGFTEADVIDFTPEIRMRALELLAPYEIGPMFTPPSLRGTVLLPGHGGGANYGGGAFDPDTNRLFVPSVTVPILVRHREPNPAQSNLRYARPIALGVPTIEGLQLVKPPYSRLTAYDLNKGEMLWQVPMGDGPRNHPLLKDLNLGPLGDDARGNPIVTKTLLFVSYAAGIRSGEESFALGDRPPSKGEPERPKFRAYDKATGAVVWEYDTGKLPMGGPMTFMHQGRQYIVLAIGRGDDAELVALTLPQTTTSNSGGRR